MDTFIIDPMDHGTMAMITAANAIAGQDEFCDEYLKAFRNGKLKR
jgi:5-methyltetrahydrofolate--homocysteine methyltransferase